VAAPSTKAEKQAGVNANHAARLVTLEGKDEAQNGKLDKLADAVSGIRVDLAMLPGEIMGSVNGALVKVAVAVLVGLILNAAAWWYRQ
jgi:hypothetical protein